jgi:hypothetical protein
MSRKLPCKNPNFWVAVGAGEGIDVRVGQSRMVGLLDFNIHDFWDDDFPVAGRDFLLEPVRIPSPAPSRESVIEIPLDGERLDNPSQSAGVVDVVVGNENHVDGAIQVSATVEKCLQVINQCLLMGAAAEPQQRVASSHLSL